MVGTSLIYQLHIPTYFTYFIIFEKNQNLTNCIIKIYRRQVLTPSKWLSKSTIIFKVSINLPQLYTTIRLTSIDDRVLDLLKILTPLEPLKRHQDIRLPRTKNAGTWVLELPSFCRWRDGNTMEKNGNVLCCYGIPGAGKTVIWYVLGPAFILLNYRGCEG